jgi:hypothetical protein
VKLDPMSAERIGAAWLRAAIAPSGDFGRRAEDAAAPYGPGDEAAAQARCAQIVRLAALLDRAGSEHVRAALRRAPDPLEIVSRAEAGDPLSDPDFFELGRFADALAATSRAWAAAGGDPAEAPPRVPELGELLARGRTAGAFYLADAFGASLAAARAAFAAADAELSRERERLGRALEARLGTLPEAEEFIAMRDIVADVPPGVRVVRETPAYRLLALELDAEALTAAARRDAALASVAGEEEGVRRDLADGIARLGPRILAAARALGELDRTLARVTFTQRWGGCVPLLGAASFGFTEASFVPLREALADAGLPYTPISLELRGPAVLTGPNMGGKSAALATCGFLAACAAIGVPPPAASAAFPLMGGVCWIGGEQAADRARLLSAFGAEVVRMRDALASAGNPALLLVDEFARTTGPREGRALLIALVEELDRRGVFALVSTHFDGVARAAGVAHLAIAGLGPHSLDAHAARDVHAALDAVARAMDYCIVAVDGESHVHSDALALAGLLGLATPVVERAAALYAATPEPDRSRASPNGA